MSSSQPGSLFISSLDASDQTGTGTFVADLQGTISNVTTMELTEFWTYGLLPVFPNNGVIDVRVQRVSGLQSELIPVAEGNSWVNSTSQLADVINDILDKWTLNRIAVGLTTVANVLYVKAETSQRLTFWIGAPRHPVVDPDPILLAALRYGNTNDPTRVNSWLGVPINYSTTPNNAPYADYFGGIGMEYTTPFPPRVLRTTAFNLRASVNAADSLTVRQTSTSSDRTILAKVPNTSLAYGDLILYQPHLPDPRSSTTVGTSISTINMQILDDRFIPIVEFPPNVPLHFAFRLSYEAPLSSLSIANSSSSN